MLGQEPHLCSFVALSHAAPLQAWGTEGEGEGTVGEGLGPRDLSSLLAALGFFGSEKQIWDDANRDVAGHWRGSLVLNSLEEP